MKRRQLMKTEATAGAAVALRTAFRAVQRAYGDLEDESCGLGPTNCAMEEKFSSVFDLLEDLVCDLDSAAEDYVNGVDVHPPWERTEP
jgi:hypothetical protein